MIPGAQRPRKGCHGGAPVAGTAGRASVLFGGSHVLAWIALVVTGLILGIGMCWSSLRRTLSGQADVDEVDSH